MFLDFRSPLYSDPISSKFINLKLQCAHFINFRILCTLTLQANTTVTHDLYIVRTLKFQANTTLHFQL